MEVQSKSGCKSEEQHNGSESQGFDDMDIKAMVVGSDSEKGKSCLRKEWRRTGDD